MSDELPPLDAITPVPYNPPTAPAEPPMVTPLEVPSRPALPRKPHPGFWMSFVWCMGFLLVTQVPPAILIAAILIIGMIVSPEAAGAAGHAGATEMLTSPLTALAMMIGFFVAQVLVIGVSWLVIRLMVGREWKRKLAVRRPSWAHMALVLIATPAMILLGNGAETYFHDVLHFPTFTEMLHDVFPSADERAFDMDQIMKIFDAWPAAIAVLIIGVGPGIGEELWCRGFLGRGLVGRYGWMGVVATSFFFGFIHLNPPQSAMAMVMGLWLHFTYLMTRSLLVPMLLHFLNNSVAVLLSRSAAFRQLLERPGDVPLIVYAAAALLLVTVGWALYQSRARLVGAQGGLPDWQPPFPGVDYPPAGSDTRVVHPFPSTVALVVVAGGVAAFVLACISAA